MRLLALVAGMLVLAATAASAEARTIVGNPMDAPPAAGPTGGATPSTVLIQHQLAAEVEAPSAGVLTEIRAHHGPIDATPPTWGWRLASGTSPNFTLRRIGTLADAPLPASQPTGFLSWQIRDEFGRPTGASVAVGDKLGWVGFGASAFEVLFREAAGGTTSFASNTENVGTFNMGVNDGAVPQAQFVLEPDTDGDSYGDETQDACIGTPGPCLPKETVTVTTPAPDRTSSESCLNAQEAERGADTKLAAARRKLKRAEGSRARARARKRVNRAKQALAVATARREGACSD